MTQPPQQRISVFDETFNSNLGGVSSSPPSGNSVALMAAAAIAAAASMSYAFPGPGLSIPPPAGSPGNPMVGGL